MSRKSGFAVAFGLAALGFSGVAAADDCPAISIDPATKNVASYPGGEPGRRKQDFSYIGAILSADAISCTSNDDDNTVVDIQVTYAIQAGTLYRGSAKVRVTASVRGGPGEASSEKTSTPAADGTALTVTDVIRGLVVGDEDAVDDGTLTVAVGFGKQ